MLNSVSASRAADPPVREVPGVGRFTVPDDHPELIALLYATTRDAGVIGVLSDWLREHDDDRADLAADLAAPVVIPDAAAVRGDEMPLITGRDWVGTFRPNGVRGRVHPDTKLATAIGALTGLPDAGGWDGSPYRFEHRLARPRRTAARVLSALGCCRGRFLYPLFGTHRLGLIATRNLRATRGVANVPTALARVVPSAVGARWLREVKAADPGRYRAIVADRRMRSVLARPAYAGLTTDAVGDA